MIRVVEYDSWEWVELQDQGWLTVATWLSPDGTTFARMLCV